VCCARWLAGSSSSSSSGVLLLLLHLGSKQGPVQVVRLQALGWQQLAQRVS
jgi:hypothetical protein